MRQEIEDYVDRFDVRFEVQEGPIARAFDEPGGGVQDQLPMPPAHLVAIGVLKEIRCVTTDWLQPRYVLRCTTRL